MNAISLWSSYPVSEQNRETIDGVEYAVIHISDSLEDISNKADSSAMVIRLSTDETAYHGPIFIDNVRITSPTEPFIYIASPVNLDTVTGAFAINAQVISPEHIPVTNVKIETPSGAEVHMTEDSKFQYSASLDTTAESEGFQTFAVIAESETRNYRSNMEVLIKNSGLDITILSPEFDQTINDIVEVTAEVANAADEKIESVYLSVGGQDVQMENQEGSVYAALFDSQRLDDGVYSIVVTANKGNFTEKAVTDIIIKNEADYFVTRKGKDFIMNGEKFFYVG